MLRKPSTRTGISALQAFLVDDSQTDLSSFQTIDASELLAYFSCFFQATKSILLDDFHTGEKMYSFIFCEQSQLADMSDLHKYNLRCSEGEKMKKPSHF